MLSHVSSLAWLIGFSALFALAGVVYARRSRDSLEDYIVARHSQSAFATVLTLLASSLGAWILFSPAQAATWGGLGAVIGYAIGSMSPRRPGSTSPLDKAFFHVSDARPQHLPGCPPSGDGWSGSDHPG